MNGEDMVDDHFKAPSDFWDDGDLFQDIANLAAANLISPWGLLGYTLALASAAASHLVVLPGLTATSHSPLNLFVAQLGATGMGKGETRKAAMALLNVDDPVRFIGVPTGEGLAAAYVEYAQAKPGQRSIPQQLTHNVMMNVDEVSVLTKSAARDGSTLEGVLCQAWSGEQISFQTSDKAKRRTVPAMTYRLGAAIGVQPSKAGPLLQSSDQGLPQRFLWMPVSVPYTKHVPLDRAIDSIDLPDPVRPPADDDEETPVEIPELQPLRIKQAIQDEVTRERLRRTRRSIYQTYDDSHRMQLRLRVAANIAVMMGNRYIGDSEWERSLVIMDASDHYRAGAKDAADSAKHRASAEMGEQDAHRFAARKATQNELEEKLVERGVQIVIKRAKRLGGTITEREILQALRTEQRPYKEAILARLEDDHGWTYDDRDGWGK